ncbi:pectate lyase family protein [Pedobacter sp.]|uniref:pectate lyase family protein n=1 Tax=Pedobacter sp. TaxID=1411316 RepID=UPI003C3ED03E
MKLKKYSLVFMCVVVLLMGSCKKGNKTNNEDGITTNNSITKVTYKATNLAFPTAEGYGKYTLGGRGGAVYEVINLNDAGAGSLRAAVEASGSRIVVFRLSGTIYLKSNLTIRNPNITIAGQTAPGDGICIANYPLEIGANQVIIRYIRTRLGDLAEQVDDALGSRFTKNLIIDHVSASWSVDETISVYHCDSMTVQWCIISESFFNANHPNNADPTQITQHGFGAIWGSNFATYHHNLIASHSSRNPRFASGSGYTDYRNNVVYNWGYNSSYGGEKQQVGDTDPNHSFTQINMVANYYKPGPATQPGNVSYRIVNPSYRSVKTDYGKWYIANNTMVGNSAVTADNWNGGVQPAGGNSDFPYLKLDAPWPSMPINQQSPLEAYNSIMDQAGCILPKRDAVDIRIVNETRNGSATFEGSYSQYKVVTDKTKKSGIIDSQKDVGGFPFLNSAPAPVDTDHDGMPDQWELSNGLNPKDPTDRNKIGKNGYPMLEEYLNNIK